MTAAEPRPPDDLLHRVSEHERWQDSAGRVGARLELFEQDLRGVDLAGRYLGGAWLDGCDLGSARLAGAWLNSARLVGSRLEGADLTAARLIKADAQGARASGARFAGADLTRFELDGADLSGADLSRTSLCKTVLSGADLSGASLREADLERTFLDGARFDDATDVHDLRGTIAFLADPATVTGVPEPLDGPVVVAWLRGRGAGPVELFDLAAPHRQVRGQWRWPLPPGPPPAPRAD